MTALSSASYHATSIFICNIIPIHSIVVALYSYTFYSFLNPFSLLSVLFLFTACAYLLVVVGPIFPRSRAPPDHHTPSCTRESVPPSIGIKGLVFRLFKLVRILINKRIKLRLDSSLVYSDLVDHDTSYGGSASRAATRLFSPAPPLFRLRHALGQGFLTPGQVHRERIH